MKLQGSYTFDAPLETVWDALFDAEVLARTLPGCEKLERDGNQFRGDINVKMGPVQGKFQGKVDITDIVERQSYTMIVDGRGPAGFGKATAQLRVAPEGSGTRLDYDSDVQVGGKIASVGQRLIDASSRAIVKQSLESLHDQIKALAPRAAPGPGGAAGSVPDDAPEAAPAPLAGAAPVGVAPPELAAPAPSAAAPATSGGPAPAPGAPAAPADAAPARAAAAVRPAPSAPSQAAFAMGVAKEVAKDLFPPRVIVLIVALAALVWLILRSLR